MYPDWQFDGVGTPPLREALGGISRGGGRCGAAQGRRVRGQGEAVQTFNHDSAEHDSWRCSVMTPANDIGCRLLTFSCTNNLNQNGSMRPTLNTWYSMQRLTARRASKVETLELLRHRCANPWLHSSL